MSLGVACFPHDGRTTAELLKAADVAVYAAKAMGRNRTLCASEAPATEAVRALGEQSSLASSMPIPESVVVQPPEDEDVERVHSWNRAAFLATVTLAGMVAVAVGISGSHRASPLAIGLLALLGAVTELLEVDLFGKGTVSVSVGVAFTAALVTGIEGLAVVTGVIAIVHHIRQRRGVNQLYRAFFNWAVHILAGLAIVTTLALRPEALKVENLGLLLPSAILGAVGYFFVETGLISAAIGLSRGEKILQVWQSNFRWLLLHYVVLCFTGLALSVTFTELGPLGVVIFGLPLLMMHYVQRQFVTQSKNNMRALQRLNRDLVRAALHDHLTGLGNERGFQEALRREVHSAAARGVSLVVVRLNLDGFKAINEELGRRHGDLTLVELANMLAAAPILHFAFRLAADDFAAIIPNSTLTEAISILDRFCVQAARGLGGATVSIGAAACTVGDVDADLLNEQSLRALNEAKRRGRNTVVSFDDIRESAQLASWAQERSVRKLLSEKQIDVAFQPIWDIDRGTLLGYEALSRPPGDLDLLGPQEAFDVASRIGRARELDAVCRAAILERAGDIPSSVRLFMNVAPESLEHGDLSGESLAAAVEAAGLRPNQIVLELTERSIVRTDAVVRQVQELRKFGFAFALDDTGAGNAGLGVLSQLKVDFVKIDRSIVNHADTDTASRAVLAGIFALAVEMGAYVIAEGIETMGMLELVRDISQAYIGANLQAGRGVQGYLLGAPSSGLAGSDGDESISLLAVARLGRRRPAVATPREISLTTGTGRR